MKIEPIQAEDDTTPDAAPVKSTQFFAPRFARKGLQRMDDFNEERLDLLESLRDIESFGGPEAQKKARKLMNSVEAFEPSVTMIGQIKSGKTSLVNALAGRPNLLPADVNPWTSVVTSLHLNTKRPGNDTAASFQFFGQSEWDYLVQNGGRIGELSSRAGASEELEKVQAQIKEMRDKTKARLGKKFELLLGQTHDFRHLDDELIQRYVCMGDDFGDPEMQDPQGQFADITKSADLYLDAPTLPISLCIRDTPGVNDTFMMREQITINALRGSRVCVVVLSATQALSSMDMGLIRLITNVNPREVVIFVNRIDELANPKDQVAEIKASIQTTLAKNNVPDGMQIVFGSAYWANMALQENFEQFDEDSAKALRNYMGLTEGDPEPQAPNAWDMSGLPDLLDAISARIAKGEGAEMAKGVRKRALNHLIGLKASSSIVSLRLDEQKLKVVNPEKLGQRLDAIEVQFHEALSAEIDKLVETCARRIDQSHNRFLQRALESLLNHLETYGEKEPWQYSPDGLRTLLRSGYQTMRTGAAKSCKKVFAEAAENMTGVYTNFMTVEVEGFHITPPDAPDFPPPVTLGQTIALDLQTSWWNDWWKRRRGYRAYADAFYELIEAETTPIVRDLKEGQLADIKRIALEELDDFLSEQSGILTDVSLKSQVSVDELNELFGITAQAERDAIFDILFDEFSDDEDDMTFEQDARPDRPVRPVRPTVSQGDAA
ncbi:MAG: dynamin family protein [Pseudomonadota bacterium]